MRFTFSTCLPFRRSTLVLKCNILTWAGSRVRGKARRRLCKTANFPPLSHLPLVSLASISGLQRVHRHIGAAGYWGCTLIEVVHQIVFIHILKTTSFSLLSHDHNYALEIQHCRTLGAAQWRVREFGASVSRSTFWSVTQVYDVCNGNMDFFE